MYNPLTLAILVIATLLAGFAGGWVGASGFDGYASTVAGVFMGFLVGGLLGAVIASVLSRS